MAGGGADTPDLRAGIPAGRLADGDRLLGHVGDDEVLLVRSGEEFFAVGAHCTHYHGPLADGLVVGDTIRCPLHHACFSLRSGEDLRPPALDPIACWTVERRGDLVVVTGKRGRAAKRAKTGAPESVVIVGGGAAGLAAAEMLRREGYAGSIAMISADDSAPCDRPNLSKEYLSGEASEDWIPLRPPEFYAEHRIDLRLNTRAVSIDVGAREVVLENGVRQPFGALLIATGADPVRLPIPGADAPHVHYLRSFSDSRAIIAELASARRSVVVGASFIGLEVAASLRIRGIAVDVVAPESAPLERMLGRDIGRFVQSLHEAKGVVFHLGETVARIDGRTVVLSGGSRVSDVDVIVMGVGVRPAVELAATSGLAVDRGIAVNEFLETSARGIFAAGDAARWLDRRSGERRRIEHWVVAERQGQVAARNILGAAEPFDAVPFFWSQHYDVTIRYTGHAETWDRIDIDGSPDARNFAATFWRDGRRQAVATVSRDRESLQAEAAMERG
ncbi:MAG TPA: FAD-dependent oxidoreductase [Vicinamibacterales bacterium]|nr:FAD-dependent oxidoreductase [Vicinamibacterales bacterium]